MLAYERNGYIEDSTFAYLDLPTNSGTRAYRNGGYGSTGVTLGRMVTVPVNRW